MILCVLVAAAAAASVVAWVTDTTQLAYASAGLAGLCVVALGGAMLRESRVARASDANVQGEPGEVAEAVAPLAENGVPEVSGETLVRVVAGRKRFHRPDCGLLPERESESLTLVEAREEGFTPCSRCRPDGRSRS